MHYAMLACKHFQEAEHNCNKYVKFLIVDKLVNFNSAKIYQEYD